MATDNLLQLPVIAFLLVFARVSTFVGFFPLFSRRQLPQIVKMGVAFGLSLFWYGNVAASLGPLQPAELSTPLVLLLVGREFVMGLILALALGTFLLPCKVAGNYIGQELGLSLASISDPANPDSSNIVSRILEAFTILIFFSLNLHHFLILVLHASFDQLSAQINVFDIPTESFVTLLNHVSDYGILVIAPLAILMMLVSLLLALLNKAAPTMNLFTIGMSIRSGGGILCMLLLSPILFASMRGYLLKVQDHIEQILVVWQHW